MVFVLSLIQWDARASAWPQSFPRRPVNPLLGIRTVKNRTLVTGGQGMLATAFRTLLPDAHYHDRDTLDITSARAVDRFFDEMRPKLVYNLAAFTQVDEAEAHEDEATLVNGLGAGNLARTCAKIGARLIHVSTDYVFSGEAQQPWREECQPAPVSAYGRSKLQGEQEVELHCADSLIVRAAWLYGDGGPNFVTTMLRLARERNEIRVVDDQRGSPTWTMDLARALTGLADGGFKGLCHFALAGEATWFEFANAILGGSGYRGRVVPVKTWEFPRPARRPAYSVLDTTRYRRWTGQKPRHWREALADYLRTRTPNQNELLPPRSDEQQQ